MRNLRQHPYLRREGGQTSEHAPKPKRLKPKRSLAVSILVCAVDLRMLRTVVCDFLNNVYKFTKLCLCRKPTLRTRKLCTVLFSKRVRLIRGETNLLFNRVVFNACNF